MLKFSEWFMYMQDLAEMQGNLAENKDRKVRLISSVALGYTREADDC